MNIIDLPAKHSFQILPGLNVSGPKIQHKPSFSRPVSCQLVVVCSKSRTVSAKERDARVATDLTMEVLGMAWIAF